jgi:hypothetical protein
VMTRAVQLADGGWQSIDVFARYPQATEDAPVGGSMKIVIPANSDQAGSGSLQADVQAFLDFGRGLDLPEGTIHDVVVRTPGGLARHSISQVSCLGRLAWPPRGWLGGSGSGWAPVVASGSSLTPAR